MLISGQYVSKQAVDGPKVTIAVPVQPGRAFPTLPAGGVSSVQDYLKIPGARTIPKKDVLPGATREQLFFYQSTEIRNLYRVQLR
jgi:hypothetical protein